MREIIHQLKYLRDRERLPELSFQFCLFLQRMEEKCPDEVLLAGALLTARLAEGSVCIDLERESGRALFRENSESSSRSGIEAPELEKWIKNCQKSLCVGKPGDHTPLVLDPSNRLYLQKYWKRETRLAKRLKDMAGKTAKTTIPDHDPVKVKRMMDRLFGDKGEGVSWQKVAALTALRQQLTIISGGPGTGKTTTVVNILQLLGNLYEDFHVALAAPTGKAASRLKESVRQKLETNGPGEGSPGDIPGRAFTLHKLLGARVDRSGFRHNADNPLPYDLVVVDEASMVDLMLMARLVDALRDDTSLILVGDKDQLASVEAGAVLASICHHRENRFTGNYIEMASKYGIDIPIHFMEDGGGELTDHIVLLEKSYRFTKNSGIGNLASAILEGDTSRVIEILQSGEYEDVNLLEFERSDQLANMLLKTTGSYFKTINKSIDPGTAIDRVKTGTILCVHRRGPLGTEHVNQLTERLLRREGRIPITGKWYHGKPVIITRNDYSLGLRNGEIGLVLENEEGRLKVYFREDEETLRSINPYRLSHYETAYAVTVHKSQGSEFEDVTIVLPQLSSPVSTRELLYTAVTRARNRCVLVGSVDIIREAIASRAHRSSGLKERLWAGEEIQGDKENDTGKEGGQLSIF